MTKFICHECTNTSQSGPIGVCADELEKCVRKHKYRLNFDAQEL